MSVWSLTIVGQVDGISTNVWQGSDPDFVANMGSAWVKTYPDDIVMLVQS